MLKSGAANHQQLHIQYLAARGRVSVGSTAIDRVSTLFSVGNGIKVLAVITVGGGGFG